MKIIIDNRVNDPKSPIITINTKYCTDIYSFKKAMELAVKLDGYSERDINTIFGRDDTEYNAVLLRQYDEPMPYDVKVAATKYNIPMTENICKNV